MKLTKQQIRLIEKSHERARKYENKSQGEAETLARLLSEFTGIDGLVDYLSGDGFGFTPSSNNYTYMPLEDLINAANDGFDIAEQFILDNLSI